MVKITAVLPAYNEADVIIDTIKAVKAINGVNQVIVVDDGSTDDTGEKAEVAGVEVIKMKSNLGKGKALKKALSVINSDIILLLDSDLGSHAGEADKLLMPVLDGNADMTVATFPVSKIKAGFGLTKGLGRWTIKHFGGQEMNAPISGQRAIKSDFLKKAKLESGFGFEVGLTIDVLRQGGRVIEVPTTMAHRATGRDFNGFVHRGKQFADIFKVVAKRKLGC